MFTLTKVGEAVSVIFVAGSKPLKRVLGDICCYFHSDIGKDAVFFYIWRQKRYGFDGIVIVYPYFDRTSYRL